MAKPRKGEKRTQAFAIPVSLAAPRAFPRLAFPLKGEEPEEISPLLLGLIPDSRFLIPES